MCSRGGPRKTSKKKKYEKWEVSGVRKRDLRIKEKPVFLGTGGDVNPGQF